MEYTLYQNKFQARTSIKRLCEELKGDRSLWGNMEPDDVVGMIYEQIGMSPTLWASVKKWVRSMVTGLKGMVMQSIGYHAIAGLIAL